MVLCGRCRHTGRHTGRAAARAVLRVLRVLCRLPLLPPPLLCQRRCCLHGCRRCRCLSRSCGLCSRAANASILAHPACAVRHLTHILFTHTAASSWSVFAHHQTFGDPNNRRQLEALRERVKQATSAAYHAARGQMGDGTGSTTDRSVRSLMFEGGAVGVHPMMRNVAADVSGRGEQGRVRSGMGRGGCSGGGGWRAGSSASALRPPAAAQLRAAAACPRVAQ